MAWIFVSHELDIVRYVADRVLVMFRGRVVQEMAAQDLDPHGDLSERALHPYTERLLSTAFGSDSEPVRPATRAEADGGCPYRALCHAVDPDDPLWPRCTHEVPELVQPGDGRKVACHRFAEPRTK